MNYSVSLKPRAQKELKGLPKEIRGLVVDALEKLKDNLAGDVKKLTNYSPEYRLRVGQYRVLFEVEGTEVVVYRVLHRSKAYQ